VTAKSILIAEDNWLVAISIGDAMREAGFDVELANCGDRAIEQIEAQPERFDILLTDIRMPGHADGWALAEHARSIMPKVPVVYFSGDSLRDWETRGVPDSVMFQKPVSMKMLLETIVGLLN
jgi:CheY-like chemotaxis protein